MSDLTTDNKAGDVTAAVVTGIVQTAMAAAEAAAIVEVPWLADPIVYQVFEFLMGKLSSFISVNLSEAGIFTILDLQTGNELSNYNAARDALIAANKAGDIDAIANAKADFKSRLAALLHGDGAANPSPS